MQLFDIVKFHSKYKKVGLCWEHTYSTNGQKQLYCKRGHEFDYHNGRQRICLACARMHNNNAYQKRKNL